MNRGGKSENCPRNPLTRVYRGMGGVFNLRCLRIKLLTNAHTLRSLLEEYLSWIRTCVLLKAVRLSCGTYYVALCPIFHPQLWADLHAALDCAYSPESRRMSCSLCCLARFDRPRPLPQYDSVSLAI